MCSGQTCRLASGGYSGFFMLFPPSFPRDASWLPVTPLPLWFALSQHPSSFGIQGQRETGRPGVCPASAVRADVGSRRIGFCRHRTRCRRSAPAAARCAGGSRAGCCLARRRTVDRAGWRTDSPDRVGSGAGAHARLCRGGSSSNELSAAAPEQVHALAVHTQHSPGCAAAAVWIASPSQLSCPPCSSSAAMRSTACVSGLLQLHGVLCEDEECLSAMLGPQPPGLAGAVTRWLVLLARPGGALQTTMPGTPGARPRALTHVPCLPAWL